MQERPSDLGGYMTMVLLAEREVARIKNAKLEQVSNLGRSFNLVHVV